MSTPPDFLRRVQDNPQIAVMVRALEHCLNWLPEDCAAAEEARAAIAGYTAATHAHYATELALDATARTGETPIDEHVRCVPGMGVEP